MKVLITLATITAVVTAYTTTSFETFPSFKQFKLLYNKTYASNAVELYREQIYKQNIAFITTENKKKHSYTLGINEFADINHDEFFLDYSSEQISTTTTTTKPKIENTNKRFLKSQIDNPRWNDFPHTIDWVSQGRVTSVKNQGNCGSCWSLSTIGAIEGIHAITTGNLISLSSQQLIDCSTDYGNIGCNGGIPIWSYEYIIDNGGICSEQNYTYTGTDKECHKCDPIVKIQGYRNITTNSASALLNALTKQPISVIIEADKQIFQFYKSGVITTCCGDTLDHAVLAVGYGVNSVGQRYFKLKNSWGITWGDKGYVYFGADKISNMENGGSGVCGIFSMPTFPIM